MVKKDDIAFTSLPYAERMKMYTEQKKCATEKAMNGEHIGYTSTNNPEKFTEVLENRRELWDSLKSNVVENGRLKKGFTNRYHEKMYEKTREIIQNLPC